jgi:hypothetical protein
MKRFLTRRESADFLTEEGFPITFGTLQKLASVGGGPIYRLYGNKSAYEPPHLIEWAEARLSAPRSSTSETEEVA